MKIIRYGCLFSIALFFIPTKTASNGAQPFDTPINIISPDTHERSLSTRHTYPTTRLFTSPAAEHLNQLEREELEPNTVIEDQPQEDDPNAAGG